MYPILLEFGSVIVPSWHVLFLVGAIAAYFLFVRLISKHSPHISEKSTNSVYVCAYIGGYFGARLLSVFIDQPDILGFAASFLALFQLGPMTFYGGAIGAFVVATTYIILKRLPFTEFFDAALPAGMVGMAFGRIGCFLNGDDFGKPIELVDGASTPWWAVVFPNLGDNVARYPVQLLCMAFGFIIAALMVRYFERIRAHFGKGSIGIVTVAAYANFRFLIEFWRGDPRGSIWNGLLSTSQFISILVLFAVLVFVLITVIGKKDQITEQFP